MYFIRSDCDQMEYQCQAPRYVIFFHFLRSEDWRGGVRRTAVDALARLFTGETWGFLVDPAGGFLSPTDLVGGLAKDNVLTKLVDPGLQLHIAYLPA